VISRKGSTPAAQPKSHRPRDDKERKKEKSNRAHFVLEERHHDE
jgi:hypothetical protein